MVKNGICNSRHKFEKEAVITLIHAQCVVQKMSLGAGVTVNNMQEMFIKFKYIIIISDYLRVTGYVIALSC